MPVEKLEPEIRCQALFVEIGWVLAINTSVEFIVCWKRVFE